MISFLDEETRIRFHELPVDKQRDWQEMAERYFRKGKSLVVLYVEGCADGTLEVSIRIDEKI